MRRFSILVILMAIFHFSQAQLTTPGTGVRWGIDSLVYYGGLIQSPNGNYYSLIADVTILPADTVEILTDDTIKVATGKLVTVKGILNLDPPNEFVLTSAVTSQKFLGVRIENTNGSVWHNATVINAGGIKLVNAYAEFVDCRFMYFDKSYSTGAIDAYQSDPLISSCEFIENAGPAVASGANAASSPQIFNCYLFENNTSNANTPQINLGTMGSDTIRIVGNTIIGAYDMGGGIAVSTLTGGQIVAIIDSNSITNNRYGIACIGSNIHSLIRNNYLADNNIQGLPMQGGSGINFYGGPTNTSIVSGNEITGNLWGITIQLNAQPNVGEIDPDTVNIGWNKIYANGNGGITYNLYNNTPNNIKAENNYWGSYIPDTVEDGIFHFPDDATLGTVDYLPLSPVITDVPEPALSVDDIVSALYPNPAGDQLSIRFGSNIGVSGDVGYISLYDFSGRMLLEEAFALPCSEHAISVGQLPEGLYLLRVDAGAASAVRKLTIRR